MSHRLHLEEGWSSFAILVLMLLTVAWSVQAAGWTEGLHILSLIVIPACVVGLLMAKARFLPRLVAHGLGHLVGAGWVIVMLSTQLPSGLTWLEKVLHLYERLDYWANIVRAGGSSTDAFIFVILVAGLAWVLAYWAAWFLFRSHWVWGAILPAGLALLLNIYYAPPRLMAFFLLYCLCALLLVVRANVYQRQREWHRKGVKYSSDLDLIFLRDGAIISIVAILLAWTLPVAAASPGSWDPFARFQEPWETVRTQWSRLFAALRYQGETTTISFGRTMTLGGGANLSSTPIMSVQSPYPRYWRATTYDRYTSTGWENTDAGAVEVVADEPLPVSLPYEMTFPMTQTVKVLVPGQSVVFAAATPIRVSLPVRAIMNTPPIRVEFSAAPIATRFPITFSAEEQAMDASLLYARRVIRPGDTYTVVSMVSAATESQLRAAGTDYPQWVRERYLDLPPRLPARVRALALEIAAGYETPYDQARAIEAYLRKIKYSRSIPPPPAGRDAVDWFLFDAKQGYCDYYASAMVVLCRAAGIPARLAQGYATGDYRGEMRAFLVVEEDSHSWPEVYFPGYGWIEFEPTSAQPLLLRPTESEAEVVVRPVPVPGSRTEAEEKYGDVDVPSDVEDVEVSAVKSALPRWVWPVATLGTGMFVALMGLWLYWNWSLRELRPVERVYEEMSRLATLMGIGPAAYQTPYEYGAALASTLDVHRSDVERIVELYVRHRFSPQGLGEGEEDEARLCWSRLRPALLRQIARRVRLLRRQRHTWWGETPRQTTGVLG
ncbi:MAG: transglutaminase domain-containing protein [Chloroflexi bacterium]|nr:transglutaminase domain-containing protein [Chloroflexota bacterium]